MADDYGSSVGAGNLGSVAIGGSVTGTREVAMDDDWFRVTLVAGTSYIFRMEAITMEDPFLGLLDFNGVAITGNDDGGGGPLGYDSQIRFTATVSGTYYLRATSLTGSDIGSYRITAAIDPNPPGSTDDYGAQAGAPNLGSLAVGGSATGTIEANNDTDWFAINLTAGTSYIFEQIRGTQEDPLLGLRDSNGIAIIGNDDIIPNVNLNSRIEYTAATTGTYYLVAGMSGGTGLGTYTVSAAINGTPTPPPTDDYGAQAGAGNLGSLTVGGSSTGTLEIGGDHDWFAVTLSSGSIYRFRMEAGTLPDPRFTVRNSIGSGLIGDDDSGGGTNAQLDFTATSSGIYYIDANSPSGAETGTYTVRATLLYGAPVIVTNTGSTAREGTSDTISSTELSTTDPDTAAGAISYTLTSLATNGTLYRSGVALGLNGTFTQADIAAGIISYTHNGSETASASFGFSVSDGTTTLSGQVFSIAVTPVNDAPVIANLQGDFVTAVERGNTQPYYDVGANALVSDSDSANFNGGSLTVAVTAGAQGDRIAPISSGNGITLTSSDGYASAQILFNGNVFATVQNPYTTANLVINFTTDFATPAAVQALIRGIAYVNTSNNPGNGTRTITTTLVDGDGTANGGADRSVYTSTATTTPFNDAPVVTVGLGTAAFSEGVNVTSTPVAIAPALTASDVDNTTLASARVAITANFEAGDLLGFVNNNATLYGNIAGSYDGTTGVLTLTSAGAIATVTQFRDALRAVTYSSSSENPGTATRTVSFTVNDGSIDSTVSSRDVTVQSNNDAPTISPTSLITFNEDTALVLSQANGNAINVADGDATALTVTLTVARGTLTLADVTGLSFATGDGAADATMTFSGTIAAINTALNAGLRYDLNANYNGLDSIAISVTDNGEAGSGGTRTTNGSVPLSVLSVNDAPAGADATLAATEDTRLVLSAADFGFSDTIDNNSLAGVRVTTTPTLGNLYIDSDGAGGALGTLVSAGDVVTAAAINAGQLVFVPNANANGTISFTFQVQDNGGGANGGVDLDPSPNTLTFTVAAVNDAPTIAPTSLITIDEDSSLILSAANGNAINVADVDATTLTVTLSVARGTLTLADLTGLSFTAGDGTADATMTFSGTAAAINTALNTGLRYDLTPNVNGPDSIAISVSDNGQAGSGGTLSASSSVPLMIRSINDAPAGSDGTVIGSENDPYVFTVADFGFSDPVEGNALLSVRVATVPATGQLLLAGNPVVAGDLILASAITAGQFSFTPAPNSFGTGYASFTFQVRDDGGTLNGGVDLDPSANTITINVTPDNVPPVVDLNGGAAGVNSAVTFTEDGAGIAIGSGIAITDANVGDTIRSMTVTLTDRVAGDSLSFASALPAGFSAITTGSAGQIVIEVTGTGTGAQYEAILGSIRYSSTNQDPTLGGADPARTITVTVNDALAASAPATATVTVIGVNDAPVLAIPIADRTGMEDMPVSFQLPAGTFTDVDGGPLTYMATLASGAALPAWLSFNAATRTFSGTPPLNYNGALAIRVTASDGSLSTSATFNLTLDPSDDSTDAQDDRFTVLSGATLSGNLYADNGFGADFDIDGPLDSVIAIGGIPVSAGASITLASGGVLTLGGSGAFTYRAPAVANGSQITERVQYILSGGDSAFLNILVNGAPVGGTGPTQTGTSGPDTLTADPGGSVLTGGLGGDLLIGGPGIDTADYSDDYGSVFVNLSLGQGYGNAAQGDTYLSIENVRGSSFDDFLIGAPGPNRLEGGAGNDTLIGGLDGDALIGGPGIDTASYQDNSGSVFINLTLGRGYNNAAESDTLDGIENLIGGLFDDFFIGDANDNRLDGGMGADTLLGAGGADTFVFAFAPGATSSYGSPNVDLILDFTSGVDRIELSSSAFAGLTPGSIASGAFVVGAAALDADDRILYNQATGQLFYDADGNGAGNPILFAILGETTHPTITAADFIVA